MKGKEKIRESVRYLPVTELSSFNLITTKAEITYGLSTANILTSIKTRLHMQYFTHNGNAISRNNYTLHEIAPVWQYKQWAIIL